MRIPWLSNPIDSFLTSKKNAATLTFGNYLFVNTIENKIHYSIKSQKPYTFNLLNNSQDLIFDIKDKAGLKIPSLRVSINKTNILYNEKLGLYQLVNYRESGLLKIQIGEHLFIENIKNTVPKNTVLKRLIYTKPISFIRKIKNDISYSIRYNNPQGIVEKLFHYRDYLENKNQEKFNGIENNSIFVTDKPKYRLNDTVFFKVILQDYSGRILFNKKLDVVLNSYQSGFKPKTVKSIASYENGLYESYFVLDDSLKMKLGNNFNLSLEYDDYTIAETDFTFEDYTLNIEKYTAEFEKSDYTKPDSIHLNLSAKDDNDIPLSDIETTIFLKPANIIGSLLPSTFIADTLF